MSDSADSAGGLKAAFVRLAGSAIALLRTRLELAGVEFAEERERLQLRLGLLFAGVLLILFGVLGFSAFVVIHFWETNRVAAILGVSAVLIAAGVLLLFRARAIGRQAATPFAATLAELEKDRTWLAGEGLSGLRGRDRGGV
jgi:uncharacterized membrane protein YqjE